MKSKLRCEALDIRGDLIVAGLELLHILFRSRQLCLDLFDFVLEGCGIDPEQDVPGLELYVRLDRHLDHLAADVGRDRYHGCVDHDPSRRGEMVEERHEHREDEAPIKTATVPDNQFRRISLSLKNRSQTSTR